MGGEGKGVMGGGGGRGEGRLSERIVESVKV